MQYRLQQHESVSPRTSSLEVNRKPNPGEALVHSRSSRSLYTGLLFNRARICRNHVFDHSGIAFLGLRVTFVVLFLVVCTFLLFPRDCLARFVYIKSYCIGLPICIEICASKNALHIYCLCTYMCFCIYPYLCFMLSLCLHLSPYSLYLYISISHSFYLFIRISFLRFEKELTPSLKL